MRQQGKAKIGVQIDVASFAVHEQEPGPTLPYLPEWHVDERRISLEYTNPQQRSSRHWVHGSRLRKGEQLARTSSAASPCRNPGDHCITQRRPLSTAHTPHALPAFPEFPEFPDTW
jgi:hypothetical protein